MATAQIQVILADHAIPETLRAALERTDASASFWPLSEALRSGIPAHADAVVIVVPEDASELAGPLRVLFDRLADHPRAVLVLSSDRQPTTPVPHPPTVPVAFDSGLDEHDLAVRLHAMLEMRESLDTLHERMVANRRSGESVAKRYARQLRLASQVQRGFLPENLPRLGPASFDVLFRPVDYVSGDLYDVHRLDEEHIGIAVADATGHGIPAALLTVYIKRALRGKEIENGSYRILSPDEVLTRLNEDILDANLSECQFVATAYAVLNVRTLELRVARGGIPYPLLRHADGEIEVIAPYGAVVGVAPEARFDLAQIDLQPGDSVVFYSDGLERIVAPHSTLGEAPAALRRRAERLASVREPLLAVAAQNDDDSFGGTAVATLTETLSDTAGHSLVTESPWCEILRTQGPAAALEQAEGRQRTLRRMGYPLDDLTVLCLQIDP